jgi:hypothetical protein
MKQSLSLLRSEREKRSRESPQFQEDNWMERKKRKGEMLQTLGGYGLEGEKK